MNPILKPGNLILMDKYYTPDLIIKISSGDVHWLDFDYEEIRIHQIHEFENDELYTDIFQETKNG